MGQSLRQTISSNRLEILQLNRSKLSCKKQSNCLALTTDFHHSSHAHSPSIQGRNYFGRGKNESCPQDPENHWEIRPIPPTPMEKTSSSRVGITIGQICGQQWKHLQHNGGEKYGTNQLTRAFSLGHKTNLWARLRELRWDGTVWMNEYRNISGIVEFLLFQFDCVEEIWVTQVVSMKYALAQMSVGCYDPRRSAHSSCPASRCVSVEICQPVGILNTSPPGRT